MISNIHYSSQFAHFPREISPTDLPKFPRNSKFQSQYFRTASADNLEGRHRQLHEKPKTIRCWCSPDQFTVINRMLRGKKIINQKLSIKNINNWAFGLLV
ncbi:hypothetical protein ACOSQ2_005046 [Xanthoceras sorbifolium]